MELPEVVRNTRVDLPGETPNGELIHFELQSNNDPDMPLRMAEYCVRICMAEYCVRIYRSTGKLPRQILLYVGQVRLQMQSGPRSPSLSYQYQIIDIRSLNADDLLASPLILAIMC
ncbi:MAG TPA: hypothetical protein VHZ55_21400 [Bryobacteraceae bacterium]|nr:hypothetical protein [Bryobacteraceae bacterium]